MNATIALSTAEVDARKARDRFLGTIAVVEERLRPSHLVGDAMTGARAGAAGLAYKATARARARPATAAMAGAGMLLLMVHRPLLRLIGLPRRR
jgi:hypothetical protein